MTKLSKPVQRISEASGLVIKVEPPDLVSIKRKGKRTWYTCTLGNIYSMAAKIAAVRGTKR